MAKKYKVFCIVVSNNTTIEWNENGLESLYEDNKESEEESDWREKDGNQQKTRHLLVENRRKKKECNPKCVYDSKLLPIENHANDIRQ